VTDPNDKSATGEKALRIGVIQGVRVIEERILRTREPVTFGTGPGNTFSLASSDLPKSVKVFDVKDGAYVLVLTEQSSGRLEEGEGRKDFAALRAGSQPVNGEWRVAIGDAGKGRIRLSPEITVLFHFVVPPPVVVAAPMPAELRGGFLKAFEPIFTAVLTASFLVHLLVGIYVKVTDPPEHSDVEDFKELVERIQPPKVEVKAPPVQTTKTDLPTTTGPGPAETPTKGGGGGGGGDGGGGGKSTGSGKGTGGNGGIGDRNAIREGIAGKGILQLIGGRGGGGGGGAVGSVFGAGTGISDDIGGALAGTAGVGIAGGAGGGDGVTRRGTGGGGGGGDGSGGEGGGALGIGELKTGGAGGGGGGGTVDTGAKTATKVVARVRADDIETVDGRIDKKSVAATIRRRQDGFQACYETALKSNSKLGGKLVVEFTIAEGGKVTSTRVINDGLNSGEVSNCVLALLKRLRFPEPSDGEVAITNAFVFQPGG
jgi:hypothetical protein